MVYLLVYCWIGGVVDCFYQCTVELIAEAGTYFCVWERTQPSQTRSSHWLSGDANFNGVETPPSIAIETRLSMLKRRGSWLLFETWLLFVVEMRPLIVSETRFLRREGTRLSKPGDHVRRFEARTQAPLMTRVWLGDPKVIENLRAWMSTCLVQTGFEIRAAN